MVIISFKWFWALWDNVITVAMVMLLKEAYSVAYVYFSARNGSAGILKNETRIYCEKNIKKRYTDRAYIDSAVMKFRNKK
jgi:hypothetical protein